jgi:outer membrane protein insertion porin family
MGEGENLGVSFQRGARQDFFSLSYSDPWFLDKPHHFGISAFDQATDYPDAVGFESARIGGTLAYGFRLDRFESISLLYAFTDIEEHQALLLAPDENGNVPLPIAQDITYTTSAIVPSYRYDSRDNPFDSFRGSRLNLMVNYSGGPFGGTINLIKPVLSATRFWPLSRTSTVSLNFEGGYIVPTQEDDCTHFLADLDSRNPDLMLCVPRSERFFAGGEYDVRGFDSYSLGPKEVINGREIIVGGYSKAVANVEFIKKLNDPLRLVLFADAGQAFAHDADFDFADLRYTAGAELRIFLPVFQFPLRFIYAVNLDEQPNDRFKAFQFSIGNTF